ncbi:chromosomal replication initiator protein DnaA [bacterium]|nr:chromosomal replication initiator protein DnaA [bacterium]
MDNTTLWQSVLSSLQSKISKPSFVTWFSNTKIQKKNEEEVVLSVPNIFVREWLQNKFESELISSFQQFLPKIKKIKYVIQKPKSAPQTRALQKATSLDLSQSKMEFTQNRLSGLNPKYTFQNFVVGNFNQLAHACAIAVVKKIGSYNPLFIYSGVGLGKTHLLEAIGNEIVNSRKRKKVRYIPCPNFTSQIITAIRNQSIEKIVEEYSNFDVFIVDDIEFIAGKERTQEVFFRVFNDLTENGKQIVLSSDRPPRAIENIEERLRSRFEGGMIADINLPDFEERMAILERKVEEASIILPQEILNFIAHHVRKNIRDLEGALTRAIVLFEQEKSVKEVQKKLKQFIDEPKKRISPDKVISVVSDFYNLSKKELLSKSRKKELVFPRQVAMFLLRREVNLSLPSIGIKMGNRDHTTVEYGLKKVEEKLKKDGDFSKDLEAIKERVYNS